MGERIVKGLGWVMKGHLLSLTVLLASLFVFVSGAQAATVTLYPTSNTVVGTVTAPTNGYADDGSAASVATSASSNLQLKGFNSTNLGTISDVTVWVKYKTSAAPSNDTYAFDAAIDGATFSSSIVAANVVNRAAYTTASLSLGALSWANVGTLAVRGATTKVGAADGYTLDFDVAYIVVTYTAAVCTPAAPSVAFVEAPKTIVADNGNVTYTVNVTNNDSAACSSTTFALGRSDSNAAFSSALVPTSLTLAPGATQSSTLTVTEATATSGQTTTTTVTASEAGHTSGTNTVVTTYTPAVPCTRNAPTFSISPATGMVKSGQSAVYTLSVQNNDTATCAATTFNLALTPESDPGSDFNLPSTLSAATINVAPGVTATSVTLTVSSKATAVDGDNLTSQVTLSDVTNHNGMNQVDSVKTTVNNNQLLHNSLTTDSTKWPTIESGKAVAGWGLTGTQYGQFTCGTCHAKGTGNIKRIKANVTAPTDTFPGSAINFQSTSGVNSFGDDNRAVKTSSNMVCEVCHSKTAVHRYNSSAIADFNHKNANQTDCITCHPHKVGFKPLACDSCHGYPPTTLAGLVTGADATGSTTFGAHQRHAVSLGYSCENCHNGYVMPNSGDIDIHFSNFGSTTGTYTGHAAATYNGVAGTGTKTCNTVYCHSTGQSADGLSATPVYSAPVWDGAAACGSCHNSTDPATGSHTAHIADGAACTACHTGNIHIDRNIDVTTGTYTAGGAPGNGYGTCSTATCHDDGRAPNITAQWGTTVNNCAECHATVPATAGHTTHLGKSFAGVAINCDDCHTGAVQGTTAPTSGHRDTNIDAVGYATANKGLGTAYTTCSTASCHQDGLVNTTHYINTPAWDADTANCTQCHAALPATGSHVAHVTTAGYNCSSCHTGATKDTSYASAAHGDLNIDVAVGGYAPNKAIAAAYTGCTNLACHSDGMAATGNAPIWGTDANCAACHLSNMATGSHTKHLTDSNNCGNCHDGAVKDSNPGTAHIDGNVDVTATYATVNAAYGSATWTTCSAASCHDDGRAPNVSPQWGTTPANSCLSCHEAIPSTGSHASHVADAATACTDCHTGAVQESTAPTAGHRDGNIDVDAGGYPTNRAKTSAFTNCTTASCHNDGRNNGVTQNWGTTLNNCSECHPTVPATAGHATHLGKNWKGVAIACADCHAGTTQGTTAGAGHRDGNIDAAGYATANKALGTAYTTCNTASCHQDGLVNNTHYINSPAWDANTANCTQCHAAVPATGSHAKHVTTAGKDCSACHTGATKDVSYDSTAHGDLNIDVAVGGYAANKVIASAYTGCTNLACHSDGMAATGNAPTWGSSAGCAACHLSDMTTGSHAKHLVEADCGACHADAVKDTTAPTGGVHADGDVDIYNAAAGDLGYPNNVAYGNTTWTTCNAASCHDKGRGGLAVTPAWGVAKTDCTECHAGTAIATGSHGSHIAAGSVCTDCHDAAFNVALEQTPATGHRDTNIDTNLALGYTQNKAKDSAFTTCATASCHNDGRNSGLTGTWGTILNNCSECHATAPTTGSHSDHSALYACGVCHTGTTQGTTAGAGHRDGNIDTAASTGLAADKLNGSAFTTCGTSNCHGSNSPVWGTDLDAYNACTQCHGQLVASPTEAQKAPGGSGVDTNGDSLATDAQVGAHQIHLNPTISKPVACSACHLVPATITAAGHIDSGLAAELTFSGLALGGLDGQAAVAPANTQAGCATTYCHDGAALKHGGTWDNGTLAPTWTNTAFIGGTSADCDNCHGYPPALSHVQDADCSKCHNVLNADDVTFTAAGKLTHVDGTVQASGGDNCSDCHLADVDNALNGAHAKHADVATYLSGKKISTGGYGGAGWYTTVYVSGKPNFGCGECHPAGEGVSHPTAGLNVDMDPAGETPTVGSLKLKNVAGPTMPTYTSRSSLTCNNIYCHSDAAATPAYKVAPNWYGGTVSGDCTECHGNSPTTNAHNLHAVGIHYDTLYDDDANGLMPAASAPGTDAGAAHGNSATSDTIGCQSCHNDTVAVEYNAGNTLCVTCHSDTNAPLTGNEKAIINSAKSTHVNGQPDVVFATLTGFKSKAQIRSDITTVSELNSNWTRTNGYKAVAGTSHDAGKAVVPGWNSGAKTCSTVECHNGILTPAWTSGSVGDCSKCHTSLP